MTDLWVAGIVLLIVLAGLALGPFPFVVRSLLRSFLPPAAVRRWYRSVGIGAAAGLIGTLALFAVTDPAMTPTAGLFCLLLLLAIIDFYWRWLPLEWTGGVIALGLLQGVVGGDIMAVLIQMMVPAGVVFAMRQALMMITGREAMGLGDIWLIAGLGAFLSLQQSALVIGFAAFSGLVALALRRWRSGLTPQNNSVSYGTHLCIIFIITQNFGGVS